jgi:hypothetical protein
VWVRRIVAAISFVDIGALDLAAGEPFGAFNGGVQRVTVIRIAQHVLEAVQRRLDERPKKMRQRRETVEHPFGTIKARMGATHFLMKTLPRVAAEMALHVLAS